MSTRRYASTESAIARSRESRDDHLRPVLLRQPLDLRVVDLAGDGIQPVLDCVEELAREIDLGAVRQVPPVIEAHPENGIARLDEREISGGIRL
jgi:hypothetical protein